MPASTERQARFMRAELGRAERGQKTRTGMAAGKLREFTHTGNPGRHGGFPTPNTGTRRTTKASTPGDKGWQGGPPPAGFTKRAGGALRTPAAFKHLGRFATGKPVTMSQPARAVPPITNR